MRNSSSVIIALAVGYFGYGNVLMNENALLRPSSQTRMVQSNSNLLDGTSIMGTFDSEIIFTPWRSDSALRNSLSVTLAFAVGYFDTEIHSSTKMLC